MRTLPLGDSEAIVYLILERQREAHPLLVQ